MQHHIADNPDILLNNPQGKLFYCSTTLVIIKALLQNGVQYLATPQNTKAANILQNSHDTFSELNINIDICANAQTTIGALAPAAILNARTAVIWEDVNALDTALLTLPHVNTDNICGATLIILNNTQEDTYKKIHHHVLQHGAWLISPRANHTHIANMIVKATQLSEISHTGVFLHFDDYNSEVINEFHTQNELGQKNTLAEKQVDNPQLSASQKMQLAIEFIEREKLNDFFDGKYQSIGIIVTGGLFTQVHNALQQLTMNSNESAVPLYVMNVHFPLIENEILSFCANKKHVLIIEEPGATLLHRHISLLLNQQGSICNLYAKHTMRNAIAQTLVDFLRQTPIKNQINDTKVNPHPLNEKDTQILTALIPNNANSTPITCTELAVLQAIYQLEKNYGAIPLHLNSDSTLAKLLPDLALLSTVLTNGLAAKNVLSSDHNQIENSLCIIDGNIFIQHTLTDKMHQPLYKAHHKTIVIFTKDHNALPAIKICCKKIGISKIKILKKNHHKIIDTLKHEFTKKSTEPSAILVQNNIEKKQHILDPVTLSIKPSVSKRIIIDKNIETHFHYDIRKNHKNNEATYRAEHLCTGCYHYSQAAQDADIYPHVVQIDIVRHPSFSQQFLHKLRHTVINFINQQKLKKHKDSL